MSEEGDVPVEAGPVERTVREKLFDVKMVLKALRGPGRPLAGPALVQALARCGIDSSRLAADLALSLQFASKRDRLRIQELIIRIMQHVDGERVAVTMNEFTDEELEKARLELMAELKGETPKDADGSH